jgi:hypothetical protein
VAPTADANAAITPCVGCGALLPNEDNPTHRYLESSPACWRLYGDVLAREYSDARYHAVVVQGSVGGMGTTSPNRASLGECGPRGRGEARGNAPPSPLKGVGSRWS